MPREPRKPVRIRIELMPRVEQAMGELLATGLFGHSLDDVGERLMLRALEGVLRNTDRDPDHAR